MITAVFEISHRTPQWLFERTAGESPPEFRETVPLQQYHCRDRIRYCRLVRRVCLGESSSPRENTSTELDYGMRGACRWISTPRTPVVADVDTRDRRRSLDHRSPSTRSNTSLRCRRGRQLTELPPAYFGRQCRWLVHPTRITYEDAASRLLATGSHAGHETPPHLSPGALLRV